MSVRDLLEFGSREAMVWAVDASLEEGDVAGVALRYDELWLALWSARDALGEERFDDLDRRVAARLVHREQWDALALGPLVGELDYLPRGLISEPDPTWRCRGWELWSQRVLGFEGDPVLVELQLFSTPTRGEDMQSRLEMVWREAGVRVTRAVRGGTSFQATQHPRLWQAGPTWGSVGGRLTTRSFGECVTGAAHVLADQFHPVQVRIDGRHIAGQVVDTGPWPQRSDCRDETALVAVGPTGGSWVQPAAYARTDSLFQGMVLEFEGARSGHRQAEIAQVVLASKIVCPGTAPLVLRHCLELRRPVSGYFRQRWSRPSRPGDSGAWLMADTAAGPTWCATIVGGDSVSTKATFAATTVERFAGEVNLPAV